jgi:hypothetical protein
LGIGKIGVTIVTEDSIDRLLYKVPETRRRVIKKLLIGAFVVPVVSVFPLDGRHALAQGTAVSNQ